MPDKMLKCGDCGDEFEWSEKDQEFYTKKGFSPPKRCKPCREARKKRFAEQKAKGGQGDQKSRGQSKRPARSGNHH